MSLLGLRILGVGHDKIEVKKLVVLKQVGEEYGRGNVYKLCVELALGPGSCTMADKRSSYKLGLLLLSKPSPLGLRYHGSDVTGITR